MKSSLFVAFLMVLSAMIVTSSRARGESLVPSPGDDPFLGELARQYERQYVTFNARPFGLSLDADIKEEHRGLIEGFFLQEETFETYASMHPFDVLGSYGEYGDLGMFGGVSAIGDALRYVVLREGGAPPEDLAAARQAAIGAILSLHMMQVLPGGGGIVARGVMRIVPEEEDAPPIPGCCPVTLPLFDVMGNPQPDPKIETWRDDLSPAGVHSEWIWLDTTSKDQVDGYAAAIGALWDAVSTDPEIPAELKQFLVDDARALAHSLMAPVAVGSDVLDMVIQDADGRLVQWFGLNPRVIEESTPIIVSETSSLQNGFNALLGLSVVKVCHHITGDEDIAVFYYDDLLDGRGWLDKVRAGLGGVSNMYMDTRTNFSNVNMAFTAIYSLLRYEGDPELRASYRDILENHMYRPGMAREAAGLKQSWFDLIFAGLRGGGTDETAVADAVETLGEFVSPPCFNDEVINCDEAETASGTCIGIDGTTTITLVPDGSGGQTASAPVPKRIRPPSNFEWRSNPFDVNGGGGSRLNPGGDFRAAYWLGRFLQRSGDNDVNVSLLARGRPGVEPEEDEGGEAILEEADGPAAEQEESRAEDLDAAGEEGPSGGGEGCGCRVIL